MPIPRRLAGNLAQTVADTAVSVTRQSGAHLDRFEAILPLYFSFSIDPITWASVDPAFSLKAEFIFSHSQEKWRWYMRAGLAGASGSAAFDMHRELYVPANTPLLYEEEIIVNFDTNNTTIASVLEYVFYYDIIQTTELEMLQEMSRYV